MDSVVSLILNAEDILNLFKPKKFRQEILIRILYIDIDSMRPDYLSCYGYHWQT